MDTKLKKDEDNKTDEMISDSVEVTAPPDDKEGFLPPPAKGTVAYKLRARWIRMLMFILSAFLVAYGLTAVMALSCIEYAWDIEAAVMGDKQINETYNEKTEHRVGADEIENLYSSLCIVSSQVLRYDNMPFDYLSSVSNEIRAVTDKVFLDEGEGFTRLAGVDDRFEYFVSYGGRYMTNIDGLSANSGYDEIVKKLGSDDAYYLRLGDKTYSGGVNKQRVGRTDYESGDLKAAEPYLPLGSAYYDEDYKAHIFSYYKYAYDTTVFENEELPSADSSGDYPYYKGGVRYKYNEKLDELIADKTLKKLDDSGIKVALGLKPYTDKAAGALDKDEQVSLSKGLVISLMPVGAVLFVIVILLMVRCGYDRDTGRFVASQWLDKRFSAEVFLFSAIAALAGEGALFDSLSGEIKLALDRKDIVFFSSFALGTLLLWIIGFGSVLVMLRKLKTRTFFSTSLLVKLIGFVSKGLSDVYERSSRRLMRTSYHKLSVSKRVFVRNIIFAVLTGIAILLPAVIYLDGGWSPDDMSAVFVFLTVYAVYFVWYVLTSLDYFHNSELLCKKLETISSGEKYEGDKPQPTSPFYEPFMGLDKLDERIKFQAQEMVRSERTKVELVTNVSHDLKTPLTSIISYTYLLSKEEMSDEARDYVKILSQKSEKLKAIVNDVFTLAKAASGAEIKHERLDLAMLINQTIASNQDIIEQSGFAVKTTVPDEAVFIMGDGDKLSRVLQNLLDNALKYSLRGTRVYIELSVSERRAQAIFKNTAAEEMQFTAEEITERFTRGDKSRTDGGSGLGLSIAKTFTEACGGAFRIELDGDVFKAIAEFDTLYDQ